MRRFVPILSIILLTSFFAPAPAQSISKSISTIEPILRFYPNPATSFVTIDFQKGFDKGYSIQVYNMLGKLVYEAKNITQRTTINLSDFTRGLYIYQLRDQSSRILETGKFQVSK
ncbi:MAG: T9SS type A sorting domain-containing protein [Flavisolibacter sp.]|nr:T9SS type A sorting domain-containing protein [Flavisolibacter sp.]MBD0365054.1 T9SS type A sorting domain-containing protein [Flavisolibacter sp.]MBD0374818.1 T9SS type A sorting domain-containing protein [Flavisolibacter sp.]